MCDNTLVWYNNIASQIDRAFFTTSETGNQSADYRSIRSFFGSVQMEYIKIGNVKIKKTAALAPMASVADRAYRTLCRSFGACYTVSELISSKGLCYNDKKTAQLCTVTEKERPMALQLFGEDPEFMKRGTEICMKYEPDIIDINMGCPVPKVVNNNSGCALMKDTARA